MLAPILPTQLDDEAVLAQRAIDMLATDPPLTRVGDLAAELGISVRSLQRLFSDYVGLGPGWVIRRYRLHETIARATCGGDIDWARLAAELGLLPPGAPRSRSARLQVDTRQPVADAR
ncbi:MAG: helix-turn-helix domain-containing protein [Thermoleophilaceae bacterium]